MASDHVPDLPWIEQTAALPHPQGCDVTALIDWADAVITVEDPSDRQPAQDWIDHLRAVHARYNARTGSVRPFPAWRIELAPARFAARRHPARIPR